MELSVGYILHLKKKKKINWSIRQEKNDLRMQIVSFSWFFLTVVHDMLSHNVAEQGVSLSFSGVSVYLEYDTKSVTTKEKIVESHFIKI